MLSRVTGTAGVRAAGVRHVHVPMTVPLCQGKVRKVDFDFHKPNYTVPSYTRTAVPIMINNMIGVVPWFCFCSTVILLNAGIGTSNFPPDPRALWN